MVITLILVYYACVCFLLFKAIRNDLFHINSDADVLEVITIVVLVLVFLLLAPIMIATKILIIIWKRVIIDDWRNT